MTIAQSTPTLAEGRSLEMTPRIIESYYPTGDLETASPGRRLGGYVLDVLLFVLTLGIGWTVWSAVVWQRGQTPGKQLLRMYVMREDGSRAGGWFTFLREIGIKGVLGSILTTLTLGVYGLVAPLWCLWDRERQCLWDKIGATYVAFSPTGFKPLTAPEFRERGEVPPRGRKVATQVEVPQSV
jgi:uncharacterized RDD family membrane protein YckC